MKFRLVILLLGLPIFIFAQNIEILGNEFEISINGYRSGTIQWQYSSDNKDWSDIKGATYNKLNQKAENPGYYRAKVTGCEQDFYSDTTFIDTYPKITDVEGNIQLDWYAYPDSNVVDKYLITIEGVDTLLEANKSTDRILVPPKANYYYKKFKVEAISKTNSVLSTQSIIYGNQYPIYGIRIDLSKPELNECERVYSSLGLKSEIYIPNISTNPKNDFDNIYPFSKIKVCNIEADAFGSKSIVYEENTSFSRKLDTYVQIPKFYTARFRENGFDYILLSENKIPGFSVDVSFVENDKEVENIYVAAYESSLNNGVLFSNSGSLPTVDKTLSEFRNLTKKKGKGFSLLDFRMLSTIQTLFLIEFANKNSQEVLGDGLVGMEQPYGYYLQNEIKRANSFIVNRDIKDFLKKYWVGMNICFNIQNSNNVVVRKITNIQTNYPHKDLITIYFDGDKLDITSKDSYGAFAQNTGLSDYFSQSGRSAQNGTQSKGTDICAIKYRGIENIWGNVWEILDGIYLDNLIPKIGMNINEYSDFSKTYKTANIICPLLEKNGNYEDAFGNISEMYFDETTPFAYLPSKNNNPECNYKRGYGDYFYSKNSGQYLAIHGGGWDHYFRAGLFCMRFWATPTSKWYLYGCRMAYKPIN